MGTPFSTVIDMALIEINSYKLDALFTSDPSGFEEVLTNFLVKSVPKFTGCLQDLSYSITDSAFNSTLTNKEIDILADWTALTWFQALYQDDREFKEALQDPDFKRNATGQNLKARSAYLNEMREKIRQDITDYQMSGDTLSTLMGVSS
jgi:hypothetical protein